MNVQHTVARVFAREFIGLLAAQGPLRRTALSLLEQSAHRIIVERNAHDRPRKVLEDIFCHFRALLRSIDRAVERGHMSKRAVRRMMDVFIGNVLLRTTDDADVRTPQGLRPPKFVLISPTGTCNLRCSGCYAESDPDRRAALDARTFDRILTEKRELWGSYFTVISGGEPLLWRDGGHDLVSMAKKHSDQLFMFYTNGTLIDGDMAARLAEAGNITPAISVEGFEMETDARRGRGVHARILRAFEALREHGVPFAVSATATRTNWDVVTSDAFVDFYFDEQGAVYGWLFQYMPIGRGQSVDMMVSPEHRVEMLRRVRRLVRERGVFIADFWNSGPLSCGCISAGRPGGYFHIDWNGDITPCAFVPYSTDNIHALYAQGRDLNAALESPLFSRIREWQDDYGFAQPAHAVDNWLCPCVIRDHFGVLRDAVADTGARPVNHEAAAAVADPEYERRMELYGSGVRKLMDPVWTDQYAEGRTSPLRGARAAGPGRSRVGTGVGQ